MAVKKKAKRSFWRDNGLSIALLALFLLALGGQTLAGWLDANQTLESHSARPITLTEYVGSGDYLEVTMENWESEFLQMFIYVVFTAYLYQRGSSESRDPDVAEKEPPVTSRSPGPVRKGGWRLRFYAHSLSLTILAIFMITFVLHARGGVLKFNEEQRQHGAATVSLFQYVSGSRFWFESLQNWQSEFLSLATMVILTIFLRERGSPESKALTSPHDETG